ncbi:flagellar basal-body rod modification protein FlgD [Ruminiclostridium sufflavum DSM 19573]|uniref:Basal-body rod modification protein FlgD n=1 Tax=Ruminiclostridium sufflavum DSM 19573 TaxID=1121337 RepID=A0A318XPK6_9FIRM|nr:flagellar hook capping FlgD N-terminal domain-containing protein [Ruminiclostridium sufflavum]PYG89824.1 flagellar basal-body rod modification protein FlgD [Ruminiclostridium sufflavum DSM 19573]
MATSGISGYIDEIIAKTESSANSRKTGSSLGKDDFLNLLVTQLRYQDPLEPTDDKEFIAQMAQFSSLEQMQNMNGVLTNSQAFSLIGKYITANTTDEDTLEVKTVQGQVSTVKMSNGKVYLVVNDQDVDIDSLSEVVDMNYANSDISNYSNLIGFQVKGAVYDSSSGDLIYLSGDVTQIQKGLTEDYAVMNNVNVNIAEITGSKSTDPDYTNKYLKDNIGKQVSITIKDKDGNKVPVTAKLKSYSIDDAGNITGVLDDVYVSVYSVSNIQKVAAQAVDDTAGDTTEQEETADE